MTKSTLRILLTIAFIALLAAPALGKRTRDEMTPSEENACEDAGLVGVPLGLCVAYCEANDCDAFPDSDACDVLRTEYERITGEVTLPCEAEIPQ